MGVRVFRSENKRAPLWESHHRTGAHAPLRTSVGRATPTTACTSEGGREKLCRAGPWLMGRLPPASFELRRGERGGQQPAGESHAGLARRPPCHIVTRAAFPFAARFLEAPCCGRSRPPRRPRGIYAPPITSQASVPGGAVFVLHLPQRSFRPLEPFPPDESVSAAPVGPSARVQTVTGGSPERRT